ncbi:MAG: hypothetical protein V3T23_11770 [Nitrososphaerales archaeon]
MKIAPLVLIAVTIILGVAYGDVAFSFIETAPPIAAVSVVDARYISSNSTLILELRNDGGMPDTIDTIQILGSWGAIFSPEPISGSKIIPPNTRTAQVRYDLSILELDFPPGGRFTFNIRTDNAMILPGIATSQ